MSVRRSLARQMSLVILIACAFAAVSCGGDDGPGPSGSTPFEQILNGDVGVFGFSQHSFTAPRSGDLTVTLTWANGAIDLDLYLTSATCNNYPPRELHDSRGVRRGHRNLGNGGA